MCLIKSDRLEGLEEAKREVSLKGQELIVQRTQSDDLQSLVSECLIITIRSKSGVPTFRAW